MRKFLLASYIIFAGSLVQAQFGLSYDHSNFVTFVVNEPLCVLNADLNGDGLDDVLISTRYLGRILWYPNQGNNKFGPLHFIYEEPNTRIWNVIVEDFDLDGDLDIAFASELTNYVAWIPNLGNGTFGAKIELGTSMIGAQCVFATDLNNDGKRDILASTKTNNSVSWFENLGTGSFGPEQVVSTSLAQIRSAVAFDADGDLDDDIFAVSYGNNDVSWFENLGGGSFGAKQTISTNLQGAYDVTYSDLDGDLDMDLIVSSYVGNKVSWFENLGAGTWGTEQIIGIGINHVTSVHASDFDGDGDNDIIAASHGNQETYWIENLGVGSFSSTQSLISAMGATYSVVTADMDNNGTLDLLTSSKSYHELCFYENTGGGVLGPKKKISRGSSGSDNAVFVDLDQDGIGDMLFRTGNAGAWAKGLANGDFEAREIIPNCSAGNEIEAADLNNDGLLDPVWTTGLGSDAMGWNLNLGNGMFNPETILASDWVLGLGGTQGKNLEIADFDNDGDQDIIAIFDNNGGDRFGYFENFGGGSFGPGVSILNANTDILSLVAKDIDNDGLKDLVYSNSLSTGYEDIAWKENLGGGNFGPRQSIFDGPGSVTEISIEDFDNDGDCDIFACEYDVGNILFFENDGNGSFSPPVTYNSLTAPLRITSADLDDDGDIDLIAYDGTSDKLVWLENDGNGSLIGTQTLVTELDGCSFVDVADIDYDGDIDVFFGDGGFLAFVNNPLYSNTFVIGKVYVDLNSNLQLDSTDIGANQVLIESNPQGNSFSMNQQGDYQISITDTSGNYLISPSLPQGWQIVTDSLTYTVQIGNSATQYDSLNFGVFPDSIYTNYDADLTGGLAECDQLASYWINIHNSGTSIPNLLIELTLDDSLSFTGSAFTPDSITGQHIFWHIDSLNYFATEFINMHILFPSFLNMGDTMNSVVSIYELDSSNSILQVYHDSLNQILTCAYDPNDKSVEPKGYTSEGYLLEFDEFEYLIRFQNTGTDTAHNVVIRDQLHDNLDWSSLTTIASSHPFYHHVNQVGEVEFVFENIELPDSNINFLGSQGFIKFRIDPVSGLIAGDSITNQASIYFDFNTAIVTNAVENTLYDCNLVDLTIFSDTLCFGDDLVASTPNDNFSIYNWTLDTTQMSSGDQFVWTSDTSGTFWILLESANPLCSVDSSSSITVQAEIIDTPIDDQICFGDSIYIAGQYEIQTGVYPETFAAITGCDSVVVHTIVALPEILDTYLNGNLCFGDSVLIAGQYEFQSGTYPEIVSSVSGCDSIIIHTVTLLPEIVNTYMSNSLCFGDSIPIAGQYESQSGTYPETVSSVSGCDSIIIHNVTVLPEILATIIDDYLCFGDSIFIAGQYVTQNGAYSESFISATGCDSTVVHNVSVDSQISSIDQQTSCGDFVWIDGITYTSSNSTASYNLLNASITGCDSIIYLDLTINTVNVGVMNNDPIITAISAGAQYQWLDCLNNMDPILGENNQSLFAPWNGSFAVEVTENACVDTSACELVSTVSTNKLVSDLIKIFPNPAQNKFTIDLGSVRNAEIELITIQGIVVLKKNSTSSSKIVIDEQLAVGMYILNIKDSFGIHQWKIQIIK